MPTPPVPATPASSRRFPRYDIRVVSRGDIGYAAFLIDRDTGQTGIFDRDMAWKPIKKSNKPAKVPKIGRTNRA